MEHSQLANAIRVLSMDAIQAANSGHPGMPMGMADVATVLWQKHLKFNPNQPRWQDRDRFVLSAGHGSMLLYALLHLTGYEQVTREEIQNFRQLHSKTPGHPEFGETDGVDCTTGPLGQGLAMAVGMALAERLDQQRFGQDLVDHYTYVIAGDGCLMEGVSQEAISFAGHQRLNKLIVLWDDNKITIDGAVNIASSEDQVARFKAAQWSVIEIDGHDPKAIDQALTEAKNSDKPVMIACKTVIGYGATQVAGSSDAHGKPLGAQQITETKAALGWSATEPFEIPDDIVQAWREAGARHQQSYQDWTARLQSWQEAKQEGQLCWNAAHSAKWDEQVLSALEAAVQEQKQQLIAEPKAMATRKASEAMIAKLIAHIPGLIGGSADLSGSNNTQVKAHQVIQADQPQGDYIFYGVREFGMAAIMNGLALHGGFVPYGGTFLAFSDYMRPAMRLAALQKQRAIYVLSHDSIGQGEDGPTHQPIEHLASLRAMPNMRVYRPCDAVETAECWQAALLHHSGPSCLVLSRQNLPALRDKNDEKNRSASGAYVLYGELHQRDVTLLATGSEVSLAVEAAKELEQEGVKVTVVSMPSWEAFETQAADYKLLTLGDAPILAIEAASDFGWTRYADDVVAMQDFGASAPGNQLYKYFGFTPAKIAKRAQRLISLIKA